MMNPPKPQKPPQRPRISTPQMPVIYSPFLPAFEREAAISIYGGYPQVDYDEAERVLMRKCVLLGFDLICPAAIWTLEYLSSKESKNNESTTATT